MPDDVKKKKSDSMKEYFKSNEHYMKGKKSVVSEKGEKGKQAIIDKVSIPIQQFSKDNEFIADWKSAKEAGDALGIFPTNITTCLKGKVKTSGNFIWKYKNK